MSRKLYKKLWIVLLVNPCMCSLEFCRAFSVLCFQNCLLIQNAQWWEKNFSMLCFQSAFFFFKCLLAYCKILPLFFLHVELLKSVLIRWMIVNLGLQLSAAQSHCLFFVRFPSALLLSTPCLVMKQPSYFSELLPVYRRRRFSSKDIHRFLPPACVLCYFSTSTFRSAIAENK